MKDTKKKILGMIVVTVIICSLMPIVSIWGQNGAEGEVVKGDVEGPDYIKPPKHYKTLEIMLAEAGLAEPQPGPPPVPVSGTRELLVILVELSDVVPDPTHTVAYFDDRFFDMAPPSVRDFYDEISYGSFTYVPSAVMGWYPSTYDQNQWVNIDPRPVVVEAIEDVDPFFDFAPYDTDDSGTVTNDELTIFIIVSGIDGGAFHWWTASPVATSDGVWVGEFEGAEFSATHEYRHIGSYCHELGHDLGLPDLYDTNAAITGDSEGIGNYGLMGGGSWTFSHPTAWSKIQLGWITPTIVTANGYYDVHDAETNAEAYILADPARPDEYFLIENRYPTNSYYETVGPPIAPGGTYPDEGMVIYHIDETKIQDWINFGINNVNVDETHKGVDVECADSPTSHVINADDLDAGVNRGDIFDLWDDTTYDFHDGSAPCSAIWYDGTPSGMGVLDFPAPAPTMSVYFSVSATVDVLIVSDDDGAWVASGTSSAEFAAVLDAYGIIYFVWSESSLGNPPLSELENFELVIWTCGDYQNLAVDETDAATLQQYLAQDGSILLEGEDIGYDHGDDAFMINVAHAIFNNDTTGAGGLTVTMPYHPVTADLSASFLWAIEPPYDDGVFPVVGGAEVIQYTGTYWGAVVVFGPGGSGSVVYMAFPLYCLGNPEQQTLAINSVNWLLGVTPPYDLSDFPAPFVIPYRTIDAMMLVGACDPRGPCDPAHTIDVAAGMYVASTLGTLAPDGGLEVYMDWQAANYDDTHVIGIYRPGNIITTGGPGVNLITWYYHHITIDDQPVLPVYIDVDAQGQFIYSKATENMYRMINDYGQGLPVTDYAMIVLHYDEADGRYVLIIAGLSGYGTWTAAKWLSTLPPMSGTAIILRFQDDQGDGIIETIEVIEPAI